MSIPPTVAMDGRGGSGRLERAPGAEGVGGDCTTASDLVVHYRIRTVRVAAYLAYMAVALLAAQPFLPGHFGIRVVPCVVLGAAGLVGAWAFERWIDWPRLFASGWGERALYAWLGLDIVLVTLASAATGGPTSPVSLLYILTTVFFAVPLTRTGQALLFGFTAVCYGALTLAWPEPVSVARVASRLVVAAMTWAMAGVLTRERSREMADHLAARTLAEHRSDLLSAVARTVSDITTLDADAAMAGVSDSLVGLGFDTAHFAVIEEDGRAWRIRHARGLSPAYADTRHSTATGMVGMVSAARATVLLDDYQDRPEAAAPLDLPIRAAVAAPVWVEGDLAAVLVVSSFTKDRIPATDVEAFEILAAQIGRALENAGRFQAEHEAMTRARAESRRDDLTGLGNRRHARVLLSSLRPDDAIVLIDLDHFKAINDRYGHDQGDQVLILLANHLRHELRGGDDVARYGGEEFLVVLREVGEEAAGAAGRLLDSWLRLGPATSFSAGVVVYTGENAPGLTVGQADAALYAAKTTGRNRVCLYHPELEAAPT